jgi:hypothetical protein
MDSQTYNVMIIIFTITIVLSMIIIAFGIRECKRRELTRINNMKVETELLIPFNKQTFIHMHN